MLERSLGDMMWNKTARGIAGKRKKKGLHSRCRESCYSDPGSKHWTSSRSVSVLAISRTLDMPCSTIRHTMRIILNFDPSKIQAIQQLERHDQDFRKTSTLEFLARIAVDDSWPRKNLWTNEAHFHRNGQVIPIIVEYGQMKISTRCTLNPYMIRNWSYGAGSLLYSLSNHIFFLKKLPLMVSRHVTDLSHSYSPATMLPIRKHIRARWNPPHIANQVQQLLRRTFTDAHFSADVSQQLSHHNRPILCLAISGYEDFWKTKSIRTLDNSVGFEEQYSPQYSEHPYWFSSFSTRKRNFHNQVDCRTWWGSHIEQNLKYWFVYLVMSFREIFVVISCERNIVTWCCPYCVNFV